MATEQVNRLTCERELDGEPVGSRWRVCGVSPVEYYEQASAWLCADHCPQVPDARCGICRERRDAVSACSASGCPFFGAKDRDAALDEIEANRRRIERRAAGRCIVQFAGGGFCEQPAVAGNIVCAEHSPELSDTNYPATDPRSPAYLAGIAARLAGNSQLIDQWQRKLQDAEAALRAYREGMEKRLTLKRAEIAGEIDPESQKLRYSNEDRRRAALLDWEDGDGDYDHHRAMLEDAEHRVATLQIDLEQFARDRVDALSESRLAAAWLQYAAGGLE